MKVCVWVCMFVRVCLGMGGLRMKGRGPYICDASMCVSGET